MNLRRWTALMGFALLLGGPLMAGGNSNCESNKDLRTQIQGWMDETDLGDKVTPNQSVSLSFMVDSQGRLVLLDVDGPNRDLEDKVQVLLADKTFEGDHQNSDESVYRIEIAFEEA